MEISSLNLTMCIDKTSWYHWGRVTHICIDNLTIVGSVNGLLPGQHIAIIWTSAGLLSIHPQGTYFNEISIKIQTFSFKKMHLKVLSAKSRPFCLGLNVVMQKKHSSSALAKELCLFYIKPSICRKCDFCDSFVTEILFCIQSFQKKFLSTSPNLGFKPWFFYNHV